MGNFYHQTARPTVVSTMALKGIWEVSADSSYHVVKNQMDSSFVVLVRTFGGAGELVDVHGEHVMLEPGTLFCIEENRIRSYRTAEDDWSFWWFVVGVAGPPPFPLQTVMHVSAHAEDQEDFRIVCEMIKSARHECRCYGMARFSALLYRWLVDWGGTRRHGVYDKRFEHLVAELRMAPDGSWTVERMARACHLGVRRFRDLFTQFAGVAPKQFYDRLRLQQGRELLRMGLCNVGEAADRLGYSSPFHFSRMYRKEFGEPPSMSRVG